MMHRIGVALATFLWLAAACAGLFVVWRHQTTPGARAGDAPAEFPRDIHAALALAPREGAPTVIMLAHPKCPCTRASIGELHALFTQLGGKPRGFVLFMSPKDAPEGWEKTDTWKRAEEIPGVTVLRDPDGQLAASFGANVSGHTVVYDENGNLVFSGGITSSRGHSGDNAGRRAIVRGLDEAAHPRAWRYGMAMPTFGCGLRAAAKEETKP